MLYTFLKKIILAFNYTFRRILAAGKKIKRLAVCQEDEIRRDGGDFRK